MSPFLSLDYAVVLYCFTTPLVKREAGGVYWAKMTLKRYENLLADVRYDSQYHPVRGLVQPDDPTVKAISRILAKAPDPIKAAQRFVDSFTTYEQEEGDYWSMPAETLAAEAGDCDDKAILLCSILRNYLPADQVYCAVGLWRQNGKPEGHMWVVTEGKDDEDRIVESTASPDQPAKGKYTLEAIFNDTFAFATDVGLSEFDLRPAKKVSVN
jgi:hypothetical protein